MTISPAILETLYRDGTIDYVPYDLAMPSYPITNNIPNGSQYINTASQGSLYSNYGMNDSFQNNSPALNALGVSPQDYETKEIDEYRKSLKKGSERNTWVLSNPRQIVKGFIGAGVIVGTLAYLFKGKKPPATPPASGATSNIWTKIKTFFTK